MSATFGNTTTGNTLAPSGQYIAGGHYQPAQNGVVNDIQVTVQNTDTVAHNIQCALYAYVGPGNPGAFIANTQSASIPANTTALVKCLLPAGSNVNAGTDYFLMATSDDTNYTVFILYTPGGPAGIDAWTATSLPFGTWPSTLAGLCTSSTAQRTIYADYTPSGPLPPPVTTYSYLMSIGSGSNPYQITNVATGQITALALSSQAFNYMATQGSGVNNDVLAGNYSVDSTWRINGNNTLVNFESGANLTAIAHGSGYNTDSGCLMMIIKANGVTVSGVTMNGNGAIQWPAPNILMNEYQPDGTYTPQWAGANYNSGIAIYGSNCVIEYSTLYNIRAFGISTGWDFATSNNVIFTCKVYNVGANGITVGTAIISGNGNNYTDTGSAIINCEVWGCGDVGIDSQGYNSIMTDNNVHDCKSGLAPLFGTVNSYWALSLEWGGGTGNGTYFLIANNKIQNNLAGIVMASASGTIGSILISGNNSTGNTQGDIVLNPGTITTTVEYNTVDALSTGIPGIVIANSSCKNNTVYGNTPSNNITDNGQGTIYTAPNIVTVSLKSSPIGFGLVSVNGTVTWAPSTFYATVGSNITLNAIAPSGYSFSSWSDGGAQSHTITIPNTNTTDTVTFTTSITPTYILNWAVVPVSGNLPFTITFSGYLSRFNNTPDTGTIVNGETIQLQAIVPGGTTWTNTGVTAATGAGSLGQGYFTGTWKLAEPTIYPGAWQFRAYYAGNSVKNFAGCERGNKRNLSRVNALIL
jgi:hypothetical protein